MLDRNFLLQYAYDALLKSRPVVSGYPVGCSIGTDIGISTGCNMETKIHTGCLHAEVHATANALSKGAETANYLCVVVEGDPFYPCGMCRQILYEKWGGDLQISAYGLDSGVISDKLDLMYLRDLLPKGFKV